MHTRIVKQTREVINDFCRTELHNKQYYVLNTSDFCDYIAKHKAIKIEIQENRNTRKWKYENSKRYDSLQ